VAVAVVLSLTVAGGRTVPGGPARSAAAPRRPAPGASTALGRGARTATNRRQHAAGRLARLDAIGNARIRRLARLGRPVFCGGPRGHAVALTFDDGPGPYTHLALRKLRRAHERATFFVVGRSMNDFPGYLPRELEVAAIGDHTYTHPDLVELPEAQVYAQLQQAKRQIQRQSGQPVDLFRPPYGAIDATVRQVAKRLGLLPILWTADSRDSLGANYAGIIRNVEAALRPGAIILMHENRGQTIRALTTILPFMRRRHLRSVSLPELFAADPPSVRELMQGSAGCGDHEAGPGVGLGAG
jgi:peptidoglycan/xylan/chitin deacetylase (PgdA/CDA1 family)